MKRKASMISHRQPTCVRIAGLASLRLFGHTNFCLPGKRIMLFTRRSVSVTMIERWPMISAWASFMVLFEFGRNPRTPFFHVLGKVMLSHHHQEALRRGKITLK